MLTHRCNRFMVLLTGLRHYTTEQLLAVMQDRRYPPLLRVAALRPVVNSLDAHALYAYVSILWPLTDHASRNAVDPRSWESAAFVETLAQRLMHAALEQLQPGIVGPDGQLRRH